MKNKKLKMDLNSAYGKMIMGYKDTDSYYLPSYLGKLSDRELISKIFYYSGRVLQNDNVYHVDDCETLHFLILEYANRYNKF